MPEEWWQKDEPAAGKFWESDPVAETTPAKVGSGSPLVGAAKAHVLALLKTLPPGQIADLLAQPGRAAEAGLSLGEKLSSIMGQSPEAQARAAPLLRLIRGGLVENPLARAMQAPAEAMERPFVPVGEEEQRGAQVSEVARNVVGLAAGGAGAARSIPGALKGAAMGLAPLGGEEAGRHVAGSKGAIVGGVLGLLAALKFGLHPSALHGRAGALARAVTALRGQAPAAEAVAATEIPTAVRSAMEAAAEGGALARAGRVGRAMGLSQAQADAVVGEIKAAGQAAAPAVQAAAPAAEAAAPALAGGRAAFIEGSGKLAAMLGQKVAPTAEAQIARAAAPAAFGNADAAIVAKIRQFAQMPGGKQKALEAAEQVFGKLRAKDMLREILRPRTTMPTVYSP